MARAESTFTVKDIPEVKALVAQLTERAEKAEAAIERVRATLNKLEEHGWSATAAAIRAALDGGETP